MPVFNLVRVVRENSWGGSDGRKQEGRRRRRHGMTRCYPDTMSGLGFQGNKVIDAPVRWAEENLLKHNQDFKVRVSVANVTGGDLWDASRSICGGPAETMALLFTPW